MITKIESLSPAQEAQLAPWAAKWTALALSTEPADRPTAEVAVKAMYSFAGLAEPEIVWALNPEAAGAVVTARGPLRAVGVSVWVSVRDAVGVSVRDAVGVSVWVSVRDSVRASVGVSVRASVGDSVWVSYHGGQFWSAWPAAESFYREACGLTLPGDLSARGKALADFCASTGPALFYEGLVVLIERPESIRPLRWRAK